MGHHVGEIHERYLSPREKLHTQCPRQVSRHLAHTKVGCRDTHVTFGVFQNSFLTVKCS